MLKQVQHDGRIQESILFFNIANEKQKRAFNVKALFNSG